MTIIRLALYLYCGLTTSIFREIYGSKTRYEALQAVRSGATLREAQDLTGVSRETVCLTKCLSPSESATTDQTQCHCSASLLLNGDIKPDPLSPSKHIFMVILWIATVTIPVISTFVAITQFPTDIDIPMHWDAHGQVDRYGSPWIMFPVSFIISACNILLALSYAFSDKLYDLGLVHGISRRAARPFLCGTAIFMLLVWLGILVFWTQQVGQTTL